MVAFLKYGWKIGFFNTIAKFETRMLANISAFCLTIFVGISVSCQALEVSNFMMSLWILSLCIFEKEKGSLRFLLQTSSIASVLGWFLYFTIYFKTESLILLAKGSQFEYSSMVKVTNNIRKESIQDFRCITIIHNNLFFLY